MSNCKRYVFFLLISVLLACLGWTRSLMVSSLHEIEMEEKYTILRAHDRLYDLDGEEWSMVEKKGNQFMLNDQPFYVNGFNTYWLMILAVDQSTRPKVTDVLQKASSLGLTVCRTWAFNDGGWRALQTSPSVYDEEVFKGLDFVVSEARKHEIRLIMSLVNNWDSFGGKSQYVSWGKAAGLNLTSNDDFFSHPTLKDYYKNHVKTVLNRVNTITNVRYKDDPTIFAWELMNEPQCPSDPSGDKLQEWIEEMAIYVKSIDRKHLLEIGLEGFYGPSTPQRLGFNPNTFASQVGADFFRNHQAFGVDFASVHVYPDSWISSTISDSHLSFTKTWMQAHITDAEANLSMPVLFTEFGVSSKDVGFNSSFRATFMNVVYSTLLGSSQQGGGGGGALLWQLMPAGAEYMDDGYGVVATENGKTSTEKVLALQSWRMGLFNTKCEWRCRWRCKNKKRTDTGAFDVDSLLRINDDELLP